MLECRFKGRCTIERDTDFPVCCPCSGDGPEVCFAYEPMPDIDKLLRIADSIDNALMAQIARSIRDAVGGNTCSTCNLMREVAMADSSRICVCDGGSDELEQVAPYDTACDKFEER